jgi:hypothetical protein
MDRNRFDEEFEFKFLAKCHFAESEVYCWNPESLVEVMSCVKDDVASVSSDMVCSYARNLSRRAEPFELRKREDISRTFCKMKK